VHPLSYRLFNKFHTKGCEIKVAELLISNRLIALPIQKGSQATLEVDGNFVSDMQ